MFHLIYKYFISYKNVAIPGIGQFSIERQPAKLLAEQKRLQGPASSIKFRTHTDVADRSFYNFLSREMNVDVAEATKSFKDFAAQLTNAISSKKHVDLPSFGTLSLVGNEISFQQHDILKEYYPGVDLQESLHLFDDEQSEEVIEQNKLEAAAIKEDARTERNSWLLYALILGLIGAAAIVYYYYQLEN